jgi:hypothetical protein
LRSALCALACTLPRYEAEAPPHARRGAAQHAQIRLVELAGA